MSMSGYTKLFNSILASTIWREDDATRIVWITLLAMSDKDGICEGSIPGLADMARVTVDDCEKALEVLSSPDKYSRTIEHEGRRIEILDGVGWRLLNHAKYRAKMSEDERREYNRTKQAEHRQKLKEQAVNDGQQTSNTVNDSQSQSAMSTHTDTDTDTDTEEKEVRAKPQRKSPAAKSAEEWLDALKAEPIYSHIDFTVEIRKAERWLEDNAPRRQFSKKYFTNWIDRIERPLKTAKSKSIPTNDLDFELPEVKHGGPVDDMPIRKSEEYA